MRRLPAALAALAVVVAGAGCGGPARIAVPAGTHSTSAVAAPAECATAQHIIDTSISAMTVQVDRAVAAGDTGDTRGQAASMTALRRIFDSWARSLSELSAKTGDPRLQTVLADYAGAVRATIGRIRGPAELEQLASFDDRELDLVANALTAVCP